MSGQRKSSETKPTILRTCTAPLLGEKVSYPNSQAPNLFPRAPRLRRIFRDCKRTGALRSLKAQRRNAVVPRWHRVCSCVVQRAAGRDQHLKSRLQNKKTTYGRLFFCWRKRGKTCNPIHQHVCPTSTRYLPHVLTPIRHLVL